MTIEDSKYGHDFERKRICLFCACLPPAYSGAGKFVYEYALRLERRGLLAFVVTHRTERESYQGFQDRLPGGKIFRLLPSVDREAQPLLQMASRLLRCCFLFLRVGWLLFRRRSQYDIVHVVARNWICWLGIFWAKLIGKKVVYENSLAGSDDMLTVRKSGKPFEYWLLGLADAFVAKSPLLYNLCREAGVPEERLFLIPYSVDTVRYCPVGEPCRIKLREKLQLPIAVPIILFLGGVLQRKGADLIPAIFSRVLMAFPSACMLLVGPHDLPEEAETAALIRRKLPQALSKGQLIFTGTVSNVQEYLQTSDVFLFPSRKEGLPNVVLEALSCGLPSAVHNMEGITSYIIEDRIEGFIVQDEDPDNYAEIIIALLSHRVTYEAVSAKARQKAVSLFAPEVVDEMYVEMYEKSTSTTK